MLSLVFPIFLYKRFYYFCCYNYKSSFEFYSGQVWEFLSRMFFCFYEEDSGLFDEGKREKRPEENIKMTW